MRRKSPSLSDSSSKAKAESTATPSEAKAARADALAAASRQEDPKPKDFDSVIFDLNADDGEADEPEAIGSAPGANDRARIQGTPSAASNNGQPPVQLASGASDDELIPAEVVRAAALDQIGPEHFRRTLIAPSRVATPHEAAFGDEAPRGVRVTSRAVAARLDDPRLIMIHEPDSPRAASLRVLRHRLSERGDPRTLVVTSPEVGDGKTTCAMNLAVALSECGRARVLLLEANFRKPDLARMLGMTPPVCLMRQMEQHHQNPRAAPWTAAQITSPWLHVLAIDPEGFKGPNLIDGPAFENTITQLKLVGYDYIVLDTPAILGSADVNIVQDVADGVLIALTARKSNTRALRAALDQLTTAKIVGVALFDF